MRGVIFQSPQSVRLGDRPPPRPRSEQDTLIGVLACGLCGSDQRVMTDPVQMHCDPDTVLGHEIVGRVERPAVGAALAPGDVVVVAPNIPCRRCESCRRGLINLCDDFVHIGSQVDGGLAEELWVPTEFLHAVPAGLDPHIAALAEPLACVLNGTTRAGWNPAEPVVVLGGGPIGLIFAALAKMAGASPVVVSEPVDARRQLALEVGADHVVDPTGGDGVDEILALVGRRGAPVVIDALGTLLEEALHIVGKGGEVFVFGVNHAAQITLTPALVVDKEVSIHGIYIAKGTFPLALKILTDNQDLFGKIISDRIPLEEWDTARTLLLSGSTAGKILITV